MPAVKGQLVTCTRCSNHVFLKYLGKNETDGGYTVWDKFEDLPKGWLYETEFGYLCPECAEEFKRLVTNFLGPEHTINKWRTTLEEE